MSRRKGIIAITYIVFTLFTISGCGQGENAEEVSAQETLQAIYIQQTSQASKDSGSSATEGLAREEWQLPAEPPEPLRTLEDSVSGYYAYEKKATQGDNFENGLYERPFTSEEMNYRPDLDITKVDFTSDESFFYFTIHLYGINPDGGGLRGAYIIEFDRTLTGRGDLLIWVANPVNNWTTEEVEIYGDVNRDVGGVKPVFSETGFNGTGYDLFIEMDQEKNAFARLDPKYSNAVQIAVSIPLVGQESEFAWSVITEDWLLQPSQFDYNDGMDITTAGSPILGENYPLKGLYNLDNTCRFAYEVEESENIPGLCKIGIPPSGSKKPGCKWRCTNPAYSTKESCNGAWYAWVCD